MTTIAAATLALGLLTGWGNLAAEESGIEEPVAPVAMAPQEIEELVVIGRFIPDEKRTTSEVSNVLDTEDLALLADTSVGDALSRVTGLSLVSGKYVYVRGLGERYSSTLLDGARISSPVPFQKTVPLDIVPNSIVRNLLVQKTFSPEYPGDFSGGVVMIRTRATPEENYLSAKVQIGGNSETTGSDGLSYHGGGRDNWGFDDGTRNIPDNVKPIGSEEFEATRWPESAGLGASFYNFWHIREKDRLKPNYTGDGEAGYRYDFNNGASVGLLAAGKYSNDYNNRDKDYRRYEFTGIDGGSTQTVDYRQFTTRQTINWSGFLNLGIEFNNDHSIRISQVILRQADDETQQFRGLSSEDDVTTGTRVVSYRLQWTENYIRSTQIKGGHYFDVGTFDQLSVNWRAIDGAATRDSPDTRTYTYAHNSDGLEEVVTPNRQAAGDLRDVFQAPDRVFSKLRDEIEEFGVDVALPLMLGAVEMEIKAGWSDYQRVRASRDRFFRFDLTPQAPPYVALMTPEQLFGIDNWSKGWLDARDFSAGAANAAGIFPFATSGEETSSFYGGMDAQFTPRIRAAVGLRYEDTTLFADAFGGNTAEGTDNAVSQDYKDTLPAASLTFEFVNDLQLRLAWSKTVNRPSLLEITGTTIRNPEDSNLYRGNVFLEPARLDNFDARLEWYFGAADSLSVGVFRKDFDNPIEIGKVQAQNDIFTWFNGEEATLEGAEIELRKDLPLDEWFGWGEAWNHFTLNANFSLIDSKVTLFGEGESPGDVPVTGSRRIARLFENEREISGQSDMLGNLILTYTNYNAGIEGSLAYSYTGERVILVGAENAPNIVEEARGQLDFLARYTFLFFDTHLELELKVKNILNEEVEWTQGGLPYENYGPGITCSLSLGATI
ncbi:MAG: TonB-dependent receptor [Gammaproteobacteria bacterium]|nr:TonB-dependent receptor [Gammaproteobacteria bacterium]MDE0367241.1 TonB-dependent receptor [Gammaproteobacteria bacterium]